MTWPLSPVSAACAPSTRRTVAVCGPYAEDEKRTRYAMSGEGIAVRINLELLQRLGRERLARGGPRRVHDGGRMDVHDHDRLVRLAWLGEGIHIREVQARVSVREAEIGTGVMVRHGSFTTLFRAS